MRFFKVIPGKSIFGTAYCAVAMMLVFILIQCGCDLLEYTPFGTRVKSSQKNIIARSIERVENLRPASPDSFVFAFLTDTHARYDDFLDAIQAINENDEVLFVIHGGDITDLGLVKEYAWASEIIEQCKTPFFPIIGNHDCLSNGRQIFEELFGSTCYTFELEFSDDREIRFIILNDNTLEYNLRNPQSEALKTWIESAFAAEDDCCGIVFAAHVPPFDRDFFDETDEGYFHSLLAGSRTILSLHGHTHNYSYSEYYGDRVNYLIGNDIRDRVYYLITLYTGERITGNVSQLSY